MRFESGAKKLGAFTFAQDCAFIGALIERIPAAHLLGHSYGGVVAIKAAIEQRDKLSSLMLIEPSCFHLLRQERQPEYQEIIRLPDLQRAHEARGDAEQAARLFIEYWIGPEGWDAMPERRKELMTLGLPKLNEDWPGTLDDNTHLADYGALSLPTLLMRAKDTRAPSFRIVELLRTALPNLTFVEIASGGHMSPIDQSGAGQRRHRSFLKPAGPRSGRALTHLAEEIAQLDFQIPALVGQRFFTATSTSDEALDEAELAANTEAGKFHGFKTVGNFGSLPSPTLVNLTLFVGPRKVVRRTSRLVNRRRTAL